MMAEILEHQEQGLEWRGIPSERVFERLVSKFLVPQWLTVFLRCEAGS